MQLCEKYKNIFVPHIKVRAILRMGAKFLLCVCFFFETNFGRFPSLSFLSPLSVVCVCVRGKNQSITEELARGNEILNAAEIAATTGCISTDHWSTLFKSHQFFSEHQHYLQITAFTSSEREHISWFKKKQKKKKHQFVFFK